jgi:hypothetical protein
MAKQVGLRANSGGLRSGGIPLDGERLAVVAGAELQEEGSGGLAPSGCGLRSGARPSPRENPVSTMRFKGGGWRVR